MTRDSQQREAQTYQSIGELAPAAEETLTHQKGWDGIANPVPVAEPGIDQLESHDFSRWNARANRQTLAAVDDTNFAADFFEPAGDAADIPPRAGYSLDQGYTETPTAATNPPPFQSAPDGTISGATAARENSGNAGIRS